MKSLSCSTEEQIHFRVNPKSKKGADEGIDGKITVEVADGDGAVVGIDDDGLGATVKPGPTASVSHFNVKADADLTENTDFISETIELTATQPEAATLEIVADAPTLQP